MMAVGMIDLRQAQDASCDTPEGLSACLAPLIGEPFRFARFSYGDELTLHFGDLRPARSPKLKDKPYGAYVLGVRASLWVLKSGAEPIVVASGVVPILPPQGRALRNEELEKASFIEPESRVLSATPFAVKPAGVFGLQLRMSDGSALSVLPAPPEPDEPEDDGQPELADWELSSPQGFLSAGPGLAWSFTRKDRSSGQGEEPVV
jgi:hypothetical protein